MNILIIGSSGFLGSSLIKALNKNYNIFCYDIVAANKDFESDNKIKKFFKANASSKQKLKVALKNIDIVFYRSGITGGPKSIDLKSADLYLKVNFENLITILDLIERTGVKKFIFDSSEQVYGEFTNNRSGELDEPIPYNFYGLSKLMAEKYLKTWQKKNDISVDIFRYSRVMAFDTPGVIEEIVKGALLKQKIILLGNPLHQISFVHIDDVISANIKSIKRFKRILSIYNITGTKPISLKQLSKQIMKSIKTCKKIKIIYKKSDTKFEPTIVGMNSEHTKKILNWDPRYSIQDIIEEKIQFILKNNKK